MTLPLFLPPRARLRVALCVAAFGCVVLTSGAALAQTKTWHRVGTVTTQTPGQFCYTNGSDMVCDSNAPSLFGTNVGIGSTLPVVSLDDSQFTDAIALPGGSNAQRPTGGALVNGEIRYNTSGTGQVEAYYNGAWNSLVTSATLGTSTPAAGSTGYVQFNNGGYLAASSNLFWNNSSGYLGIGTASPQKNLDIWSNSDATLRLQTPSGSGYGAIFISSASSNNGTSYYRGLQGQTQSGTSHFFIGQYGAPEDTIAFYNGSGLTERMRITSGGNVGIGTAAPGYPLVIHTGTNENFEFRNVASVASLFVSNDADNTAEPLSINASSLSLTEGSTQVLTVNTSGNVGIGTATPLGDGLTIAAAASAPPTSLNNVASTFPLWITPSSGSGNNNALIGFANAVNSTNLAGGIGADGSGNGIGFFDRDGQTLLAVNRASGVVVTGQTLTASNTVVSNVFTISPQAWTGNGTEIKDFMVNPSTLTLGAGATLQRFNQFTQPTVTAASALAVSDSSATTYISGAPIFAGLATTPLSASLFIDSNYSVGSGVTNAYGLYVSSPTGAVNNYAAAFTGGNVGIGTTAPGSSLQVNGGAAIGYSTNTSAPSNGMLVSGQLGVGTTNPTSDVKADINGAAQIAGTGSETCATMADAGKMRFNPSKNYFEICSP